MLGRAIHRVVVLSEDDFIHLKRQLVDLFFKATCVTRGGADYKRMTPMKAFVPYETCFVSRRFWLSAKIAM